MFKLNMKIFAAAIAALVLFGSVADVAVADWGRNELKLRVALLDGNFNKASKWIRKGADVNAYHGLVGSLLHNFSDANSDEQVANWLIGKGADVNAKNIDGDTPLHEAASRGAFNIAELLINKGADVNAKNNDGNTPLHSAASSENYTARFIPGITKYAKVLLNKGANINAKNNQGKTPPNLARENGYSELVEVIDAPNIAKAKAAAARQAAAAARQAAAARKAKAAADAQAEDDLESANIAYKVGNYQAAFPLYKSLAEGGNEYAQGKLAVMYEKGQGTDIDTDEAKGWYRRIIENEAGKPAVVAWAKERFYSLP